ncbi:MAG: glucose/galactose MFS transporter [Acetobacter aceti]|uniref:Glucose/galactose transporter n=1 Tax=Acetobacter aceti TaxID=435 RepID=A0A1U9KFQ7_ACEAC|nr:glucose/galactose MFS transporter [Acetobacter aceti]AQS84645.1 glucose/galactose transporter [Acetobacter aceti]
MSSLTHLPKASLFRCPAGSFGWAPLASTASLFFLIGFVTWLNGPLISFVRVAFSLSDVGAFLVPLAFYIAYLLFALPAARIVSRTGLKSGLALALAIMGIGSALFGQCVGLRSYPGALGGLMVIGAGLTLLQVTVNPYVSLLGPHEQAAQRIAIMGLCNKFAGILAPIVLAAIVMHNISGVAEQAQHAASPTEREAILSGFTNAIYWPYLGMAALLGVAACAVFLSNLPDLDSPAPLALSLPGFHITPRLGFGMVATFLYVGIEVLAGDAIGTYGQAFGMPLDQTRFFTAFTLFAMMTGYAVGLCLVPRVLSQERCMILSCAAGILFAVAAYLTTGYVSVLCVALLGLANAMIMPALFPMTIRNAGHHVPLASALLVMMFSGGACTPQIFVLIKPYIGVQAAFLVLAVPAYLVLLGYGVRFSTERGVRKTV